MGTKISLKQLGTDIKTLLYYGNSVAGDTPVGEIIAFMGNAAPPNYLICDGAEYNISDYPHLANHIRDSFGTVDFFGGDGQDTFSVPDLRGEFLRGSGKDGEYVGGHQNGSTVIGGYFGSAGGTIFVAENMFSKNAENETDNYKANTGRSYYHEPTGNVAQSYGETIGSGVSRPTNTSVLYCIKCKPSESGHTYSYEERRVGTWIDGKPLYEKTVNFGALPNATTKEVPHGIENADVIWIHDGFSQTSTGEFAQLNAMGTNSLSQVIIFMVDRTKIISITGTNRLGYKSYVTLRYTKTTDQPLI